MISVFLQPLHNNMPIKSLINYKYIYKFTYKFGIIDKIANFININYLKIYNLYQTN